MGKFAGKPAGEICWGNLLGKFPWNSARKICWENLLGNLLGKSCQGGITFEGYFCRKSPGISPGFRRPQAARSAIFIIIENNYKPAAGADFFLGHTTPQFLVIFQGGITFEGDFCRKSPGISTGFRRPLAAHSANLIIIENNYKLAAGADFFWDTSSLISL